MIHFVSQLQYYILFEVIESGWTTLQTAIARPDATLNDLISAHTNYLRGITRKGLLGSTRTNSQGVREDVFTAQLHELLKLMLAYKDAVDGLYSFSVTEFTRRQELAAKIETRTAKGQWGLSEKDDLGLNDDILRSNTSRANPSATSPGLPPDVLSSRSQPLPAFILLRWRRELHALRPPQTPRRSLNGVPHPHQSPPRRSGRADGRGYEVPGRGYEFQ